MKQWIELTQEQQEAVTAALAYPFPPDEIEWLALATYEKDGQHYAKGGAYADLRAYQYRLDTVCGQNWTVRYRPLPAPPKGNVGLICSLTIYGRTMEDIGEAAADDPNAWTCAMAQAFKRTASALQRMGRYLYDQDAPWVPYDKAKKRFTKEGEGILNKHYFAWYVQATGQKTVRERQAPQLQTSNEQQQTTEHADPERPAPPRCSSSNSSAPQQQQTAPQQQQQPRPSAVPSSHRQPGRADHRRHQARDLRHGAGHLWRSRLDRRPGLVHRSLCQDAARRHQDPEPRPVPARRSGDLPRRNGQERRQSCPASGSRQGHDLAARAAQAQPLPAAPGTSPPCGPTNKEHL